MDGAIADFLGRFTSISAETRDLLKSLERHRHSYGAGTELLDMTAEENWPFVLLSGYAIEYRLVHSGRRQVSDILLPGQIGNMDSIMARNADQFIAAVTDVEISRFSPESLYHITARHPKVGVALVWVQTLGRSRLAEHLVDIGRRNAYQRLGHLLLELLTRLEWGGLAKDNRIDIPIGLAVLGDMLGLSFEHVSRTLSKLKSDGLVDANRHGIVVTDRQRLTRLTGFDPGYLHLSDGPRPLHSEYN